MLRMLLALLRPLPEIVKELRTLRELYELDLASRQPPIYRVTERPKRSDTEIFIPGREDTRPAYKRWLGIEDEEEKLEGEEGF